VDDDPGTLRGVALCVRKWGVEVDTVFNRAEAIDVLGRIPLAGKTLGIRMPRMNSFEVLRHLRQRDHKMPVIMISGWLAFLKETDSDHAYLRGNAQGLFLKSVSADELMPIVDRWVGKCCASARDGALNSSL
jgi:DNA-binding response OmpR family regulator